MSKGKEQAYYGLPVKCPNCKNDFPFLKLPYKHKTYQCMKCLYTIKGTKDGWYKGVTDG